jgi:hypothetical protein
MIGQCITRFGICEAEYLRIPMYIPDLVELNPVVHVCDIEAKEGSGRSVISELEAFAEVSCFRVVGYFFRPR